MAEAGFSIVRLEPADPQEGTFVLDWLDRATSILAQHNVQVVLGTPTAASPPWLTARYSKVLSVGPKGERGGIDWARSEDESLRGRLETSR